MEKRKPHAPLTQVRELITTGAWRFTQSARVGALELGLDEAGALAVVANLTSAMFFKSMTTHADHTVWQDVYRAPLANGQMAYVKLTLLDGLVVVSFKEK